MAFCQGLGQGRIRTFEDVMSADLQHRVRRSLAGIIGGIVNKWSANESKTCANPQLAVQEQNPDNHHWRVEMNEKTRQTTLYGQCWSAWDWARYHCSKSGRVFTVSVTPGTLQSRIGSEGL